MDLAKKNFWWLKEISSCLNRSFWNSFISWNLWISLCHFWNRRNRYVCEKGNGWGTRTRMSTKSVSRYKKLLTTQVENLHAVCHVIRHKTLVLWTTPKTLEIEWRNRLKELRIRSGLHSRKVELYCPMSNTFMPFVSTLNYVSPIGANSDKRRWNWDGGGLDRELSTCLSTNYKKRINSR